MHSVVASTDERGNQRRRCLTTEEMTAKGMARNSRGHWQRGKAGRLSDHGSAAQLRAA